MSNSNPNCCRFEYFFKCSCHHNKAKPCKYFKLHPKADEIAFPNYCRYQKLDWCKNKKAQQEAWESFYLNNTKKGTNPMTKAEIIQKWESYMAQGAIWDIPLSEGDLKENGKNYAMVFIRLFLKDLKQLEDLSTVGEFDLDDPLGEKEMSDRIEFIKNGVIAQLTELVKSDTDTGQQYMWGLASVGIGAEGSENPTNIPRIRMSLQDAIKLIVELSNKFNVSEENRWK